MKEVQKSLLEKIEAQKRISDSLEGKLIE